MTVTRKGPGIMLGIMGGQLAPTDEDSHGREVLVIHSAHSPIWREQLDIEIARRSTRTTIKKEEP